MDKLYYEKYENGNIIPCEYGRGIRKCKLCEILLSKTRECHKLSHRDDHDEWISVKYGDYYNTQPNYCKNCYDKYIKGNEKFSEKKSKGGLPKIKIKQLTFSGDIVKVWDSTSDASKELGISYTGIRNCINKITKTFNGFKWENLNNGNQ